MRKVQVRWYSGKLSSWLASREFILKKKTHPKVRFALKSHF